MRESGGFGTRLKQNAKRMSSLIRASLSEGMGLFEYKTKNRGASRIVPFVLIFLAFGSIFSSALGLAWDMKQSGTEAMILSLFTLATFVLIIAEGIYKSSSLLFNCKDNDMLLSMPIKKSEIVFLRIFKFYLFQMIYNAIFLGPGVLAYAIVAEVSASYYFVALLAFLLLPVIPVAISCVAGALTSILSSKFRKKNLLQIMFSFLWIGGCFALAYILDFFGDAGTSVGVVGEKFMRVYYPARAFVKMATEFDIITMVIFIAINLAVFGAVVLFISKIYFKIVTRVNTGEGVERRGRLKFTQSGKKVAIIRKEIRKYFSTPVLVSNTAIGLILYLFAIGAVCLKFDEIAGSLAEGTEIFSVEQIRSFVPTALFCLVIFTSMMTFISATMISLEGKAFNILKTLPMRPKDILEAKVLASVALIVPALLLGEVAMFVVFPMKLVDMGLILAGTLVFPLLTETVGIFIDLKYTKFDAESETEVVKQSAGIMVASFSGLFLTVLTVSLGVSLAFVLGQTAGMAILVGGCGVIDFLLWRKLGTSGEKKFYRLEA
ncbi:hypothetical protein IKG02_00640 [Candidatus Saccharibacteria bacterium]|nr:hypothetical protein [Candidatus Saccharibacteria bacterium]